MPYSKTMIAKKDFDDMRKIARDTFSPDEFEFHPNSVIFVEHETKDSKGNDQKYNKAALQSIADRCNARILDTGDFAPIAAGHTPDRDEIVKGMPQPDVLGCAGMFRVEKTGYRKKKWAIVGDEWHRKADRERLSRLPRRSVELWMAPDMADRFLDPIAALGAETPRLDTGLRFARGRCRDGSEMDCEKYTATVPAASNTFIPEFGTKPKKETYAMLSPEDKRDLIAAILETQEFQFLQGLMNKETAGAVDDDFAGGMEAEEAMGGDMGGDMPLPEMPPEMPAEEEPEEYMAGADNPPEKEDEEYDDMDKKGMYQKQQTQIRELTATVEKFSRENNAIKASQKSLIQDAADSKREGRIAKLCMERALGAEGEAELLEACLYSRGSELTDKAFDDHLAVVEKYSQPMPEIGKTLPHGQLPRAQSSDEAEAKNKADFCMKYHQEEAAKGNHIDYADCEVVYKDKFGK